MTDDQAIFQNEHDKQLLSDSGTKLLSERLKQTVVAIKDFAAFLRRKSTVEDESYKAMQRTTRLYAESLKSDQSRQGDYVAIVSHSLDLDDAATQAHQTFAKSLFEVATDLAETAKEVERSRKAWKEKAQRQDKHVLDLEAQREKAIQKYTSATEELEKLKSEEGQNRRTGFSFKSKAGNHMDDLVGRVTIFKTDMQSKQEAAQAQRSELMLSLRPQSIAEAQKLAQEGDSTLKLQMLKFARLYESFLLSQCMAISPTDQSQSLRSTLNLIDDSGNVGASASSSHSLVNNDQLARPSDRIFGSSLAKILAREDRVIPACVEQCIELIEGHGLTTEGLYRLSGSLSDISALKGAISTGVPLASLDSQVIQDPHSLCSVLKLFFRELSEPLIPNQRYNEFVEASRIPDEPRRRIRLHQAVNELPDESYALLRYLFLHLHRIHQNRSLNLMSAANLAIVWGPTLLGDHSVEDMPLQSIVVETIILNCLLIFEEDTEPVALRDDHF